MATYFVDQVGGLDANAGTSPAAAWKTFAGSVNGKVFSAGDSILLKRGCVWNEQLIPPSSGASGNPIKFGAYGSGAPPTITAKTDLSSAGAWSYDSGTAWKASLLVGTLNNVVFGANGLTDQIWGTKKATSQANVVSPYDWYLDGSFHLFVYTPSNAINPATYYGSIGAMIMATSRLLYVSGKTNLEFQQIKFDQVPYVAIEVDGASDNITFANCYIDGKVPAAIQPLGFYIHPTTNPAHINIYNCDAHRCFTGFRIDATTGVVTIKNCRAYANRNNGLQVTGSSGVTYDYCHFYANGTATVNSQDVSGGTDGGHNVYYDVDPTVNNFARWPARVSFTVDDEGKAQGTADYIDSLIPQFDKRNLKMCMAVVTGEQYAVGDIPRIQKWFNNRHDVNSHSWSHTYYNFPNAFSIQYIGAGSACVMTISGNMLTTTVTGGPGGENLSFDLTNPAYAEMTQLSAAIGTRSGYTTSLICMPHTHSKTLADVASQDIRTGAYTTAVLEARFTPDELATSKAWLEANISGLVCRTYVYPSGYQDAASWGYAVAAGYSGARGTLSGDVTNVMSAGVNVQNITSPAMTPYNGVDRFVMRRLIRQLVFKSQVWGIPYGLFCHVNEITPDDVGNMLDALMEAGAIILTNTQIVDYLRSLTNISATFYVNPAAPADIDFTPQWNSPSVRAAVRIGGAYAYDINGNDQDSAAGGQWAIGAQVYVAPGGKMAKSKLLALTTGGWTQIVAQSTCRQVKIMEDAGGATNAFKYQDSLGGDTITFKAGYELNILGQEQKMIPAGTVLGQLQSVTGSVNFLQFEA